MVYVLLGTGLMVGQDQDHGRSQGAGEKTLPDYLVFLVLVKALYGIMQKVSIGIDETSCKKGKTDERLFQEVAGPDCNDYWCQI